MNVRSRFSVLRRSLLAGVFCSLALLGTAGPASAQGAPPGDSVTQLARQRYGEGVQAYDAGRFEDARKAFQQAYALKHHPAVLLNLGQSELKSGHFDDAGNHFQQFLREHTAATADEKATAEKGLAECKKKTGQVVITVDSPGADISIDGTTVGKSPLIDPVFVAPGKHTIFAAFESKTAAASIEVKAGASAPAALSLGAGGASVPVPGPTPEPTPTPTPPTPSITPTPTPTPMPPTVPPSPTQHMTFGEWYRHKPIAWVGTGVAGLGLIGGIIFSSLATSASSKTQNDVNTILTFNHFNPQYNPTGRANLCGDANGNGALPEYVQPCQTVLGDISNYHTDVALAATSWVLFGVGVVGTGIYAMIDWFPKRASGGTGDSGPSGRELPFVATPIVSPTMKGIGFAGSF